MVGVGHNTWRCTMEITVVFYNDGDIKGVFMGSPEDYAKKKGLTVQEGRNGGGSFVKEGRMTGGYIVTSEIK